MGAAHPRDRIINWNAVLVFIGNGVDTAASLNANQSRDALIKVITLLVGKVDRVELYFSKRSHFTGW